jgi:hypothetical protein
MPRKARGVSWERIEPGESLLADGKHGLMFLYMCGRELERQVHETCFVSITGSLKALRFPRYVFSQALNALVCYISRANSNPPAGPDLPYLGSLTRVLVRLPIFSSETILNTGRSQNTPFLEPSTNPWCALYIPSQVPRLA